MTSKGRGFERTTLLAGDRAVRSLPSMHSDGTIRSISPMPVRVTNTLQQFRHLHREVVMWSDRGSGELWSGGGVTTGSVQCLWVI